MRQLPLLRFYMSYEGFKDYKKTDHTFKENANWTGEKITEVYRQAALEVGPGNFLFTHETLVLYISGSGEHKSKPTQHSVKELQPMGSSPNIIVLRCDKPLEQEIKDKKSLFYNVKPDCIIENTTLPILYQAPVMLEKNHFSDVVCRELHLSTPAPDMREWTAMLERISNRNQKVCIALVGKYVKLHDAYLSVAEALSHGGFENGAEVNIKWIDSETLTEETLESMLGSVDGILVPGGVGNRGIDGKFLAARCARENDIPYLGICLGMQTAVIEYFRNVVGYQDAYSTEVEEGCPYPVIALMPDQQGIIPSGTSPDNRLVEAVEIKDNRFFVAVQHHPEIKSRPNKAHPLFREFIKASLAPGKGVFNV